MATLQEYDQVMKKCLEDIININLGQEAWTQSSLPVKQRQRGIGVRGGGVNSRSTPPGGHFLTPTPVEHFGPPPAQQVVPGPKALKV